MARAAPLSEPVTVLGASGMLGRAVVLALRERGLNPYTPGRPDFDLSDRESIGRTIDGPGLVINCAAFTDVDGAEWEPELARTVNGVAAGWLGKRCREVGALLVHYSSDYVFDGQANRPYRPNHPRRPLNIYGQSKAEGEEAIEESGAAHLILRTSWLYAPWGKNFVRTIAKLASERPVLRVVNDQAGRPTSAEQLARTTLAMLESGARGIHHATDGGSCTWFTFASAVVAGLGLPAQVEPCTSAEFPRPARRPAYSVLDLRRTEAMVGPRRPWNECLAETLRRLEGVST